MKWMRWLRYPLLLLAVVFIPYALAVLFLSLIPITGIIGYILGYLLIYGFTGAVNRSFHKRVYSNRIRRTYLITNAIVSLVLLGFLDYSTTLLFGVQPFNSTYGMIFIGFPWVSVQMLLLLFFVRSERLYR